MKYVKRVGFRSCLCVVCLVLKLLLAATHKTLNRDNITKNVHCRVRHANCQCKRQVPRTANHATTNATTGSGGGCEHSESMLGGTAMTVEQTTASPPPIPAMNAGAREDCGATKSATAALPVLMPATTVTNGEAFTAATPAVTAAPPSPPGNASASDDSDYEPDSDCNSEYNSEYDSEWEVQLEDTESDAATGSGAKGCIQAMLATRSITQCLKHIMCPMEQVPGFQSRTFKKACMLGECPHCGWEKKLDYVVKSDFSITWQGFERLRVGNQRQNTPYGQEAAFVEGEKKTRQERVKMDGLFRGDFKAAPSNKWWQTKPLLGGAVGSMLVKDLKVALKARGQQFDSLL